MGAADLRAGGRVAAQMLQRPAGAGSSDATARVTAALGALGRLVDELDPAHLERHGLLGRGEAPARYFARYRSAQAQLDRVVKELVGGQDELRRDNAAIDTERAEARASMAKLSEYVTLAGLLDEAMTARAAELTTDALTAVRQRRQDVLVHLAVVVQGELALEVVRRNNRELIRAVERARTATVRVLRAAVAAAHAVAGERLVLDAVRGVDTGAATGDLDGLRAAFGDLRVTMEAIDRYREDATANLAATAESLRHEVARAGSAGA
jgi:uncharacterized protein YaaN involved in tellurite resistance